MSHHIRKTYTAPTSVTLNTGTSADAVSDLQTLNDGNLYSVAEVTGSPGYDLEVVFSGIVRFVGFVFKAQYDGASTHWCEVDVYNYTGTSWDTMITMESSNGENFRYIEVPETEAQDYVSAGAAKIRFYHPNSGNAAHDLYVDYVAVMEL